MSLTHLRRRRRRHPPLLPLIIIVMLEMLLILFAVPTVVRAFLPTTTTQCRPTRRLRLEIPEAKRKKQGHSNPIRKKKEEELPRLVIFDLDGCLWRPELLEISTSTCDAEGSPLSINQKDEIPGTTLKNAGGSHTLQLLGDTRQILYELFFEERCHSLVVISSGTHPQEWAEELLELFSIYDEDMLSSESTISMKDAFTPHLCLLDRAMDKAQQFQVLIERANEAIPFSARKIRYNDAIFFDNEAGNCKQVSRLGVTTVYTPKGLTKEAWENGLNNFPSTKALGPKLPC